jgi:hypothetical protein
LTVAICSRVVALRFLPFTRVVDDAMVTREVEDTIGGKEGDGFGDVGVDAEDVLELEDLLRNDRRNAAGLHLQLQKYI